MSRRVIPKEDWGLICARYKEGENSTDIAKDYSCPPSTICAGIQRSGFKLRPQRISKLRGRDPISKKEQDSRYYKKHGNKVRAKLREKYAQNPEYFRSKSRAAVAALPRKGITQKRCNGCRLYKPFKEYGAKLSGKYRLRARCKTCEVDEARAYRNKHPEKILLRDRLWRMNTPIEKRRDIRNRSNAKSMKNPLHKLKSILRKQLLEILKSKGLRKSPNESALKLVGCTVKELKAHIESQFTPGMNWGNHGVQKFHGPPKWHIDHIKDVQYYNLSKKQERYECFHYTNLRPMWARANIRKSKKSTASDMRRTFLNQQV